MARRRGNKKRRDVKRDSTGFRRAAKIGVLAAGVAAGGYKIISSELGQRAIKSGLFDFIAHPDLYMINYPRFDSKCEKIAHEICRAAEEYDIPLEINANGIRRGLKNKEDGIYYSYPCYKFWDIAKNYQIRIIVNSDCHGPKFLADEALDEAYRFAQSLGLEIIYELPIKERG